MPVLCQVAEDRTPQEPYKTLNFVHCDVIESERVYRSVLMLRGCGLARYGDGLQRSLRSLCSQMMNNGSTDLDLDDDPLEH